MTKKVLFYMHNGSGNHGCEALVRSIANIIDMPITLYTRNAEEDKKYIDDEKISYKEVGILPSLKTFSGVLFRLKMKLLKQKYAFVAPAYKNLLKDADSNSIAFSIGGDNYCYDGMPEVLSILNNKLNKCGANTVLYGCSIEPKLLEQKEIVDDLSNYKLIVARESITYNAMKNVGVNTEVVLAPDPAFTLETKDVELPQGFEKANMIGINISPLILDYGSTVLFDAYCNLIKHIIENTDMNVALIPHVVWKENNDITPIKSIFDKINNLERVIQVDDCSAVELKYIISNCRMFIGARTHSTIAAYSTCVPTVVIGYSVKSRGIARDLFGTEENYVVNSDSVTSDDDLIKAFEWLKANEQSVRAHLEKIMPEYVQKTYLPVEKLKELHLRA